MACLSGTAGLRCRPHGFAVSLVLGTNPSLIFPRWDVIAIILGIFLLTYTYIEARSNYHRGSILVLSYVPYLNSICR